MSISLYTLSNSILKFYTSFQVGIEIDCIYKAIYSIYNNISNIYYKSAKESIEAAEHSTDPASELRIAKNNLVSAYEAAKRIQSLTVKKRYLLFFTSDESILNYEDYRPYHLNLSKLSAYISLLYRKLGEKENEQRWGKIAFEQFDVFLEEMSLNYDEREQLYKKCPFYIDYSTETNTTSGPDRTADPDIITTIEHYDLNEAGKQYEQELKDNLLAGFKEAYEKGFVFLERIEYK